MAIATMPTVGVSPEEAAAAAYLAGVGPVMAEGSAARQALVDGLTRVRAGDAGVTGLAERQGETFRVLRLRLGRLALPRSCSRCHAAVARWLELHEAACMTLAAGGPKAQQRAAELVADARGVAQQFTAEYTRLAAEAAARQQAIAAEVAEAAPAFVEDEPTAEAAEPVEPEPIARGEDDLLAELDDAADLDDADELAVEQLATRLAQAAAVEPGAPVAYGEKLASPILGAAAAAPVLATAKPDLDATARANGDAAWGAHALVSQARGLHPHGPVGSWLGAVEAVLAASVAVTAFIVAAEVALD